MAEYGEFYKKHENGYIFYFDGIKKDFRDKIRILSIQDFKKTFYTGLSEFIIINSTPKLDEKERLYDPSSCNKKMNKSVNEGGLDAAITVQKNSSFDQIESTSELSVMTTSEEPLSTNSKFNDSENLKRSIDELSDKSKDEDVQIVHAKRPKQKRALESNEGFATVANLKCDSSPLDITKSSKNRKNTNNELGFFLGGAQRSPKPSPRSFDLLNILQVMTQDSITVESNTKKHENENGAIFQQQKLEAMEHELNKLGVNWDNLINPNEQLLAIEEEFNQLKSMLSAVIRANPDSNKKVTSIKELISNIKLTLANN